MILYYFPIAQNTGNKTVSDFFQRCKCLFINVHIFYYFSIYWSDTSLSSALQSELLRSLRPFVNMTSCVRGLPFVAWMKPNSHLMGTM